MNRAVRGYLAADPLPVTSEQVEETIALAEEYCSVARCSFDLALHYAARKVAGRHQSMPGPIIFAAAERIARTLEAPGVYISSEAMLDSSSQATATEEQAR